MIESYLIGTIGTIVLATSWLGVQLAFRRVFPPATPDADALAGRGCGSCTRSAHCERRFEKEGQDDE